MGHYCCCIVGCKNNSRNSQCKFYIFPKAAWKLDQRYKWMAAVKRKNVDGSPWSPKPDDKICSEHFIGGKKSDAQASPSYVPTIFPKVYRRQKINESHALARYTRLIKLRTTHVADTTTFSLGYRSKHFLKISPFGIFTINKLTNTGFSPLLFTARF
ncbi:hypothetical protein PYW08_007403 [Mythimna loreyi]|uniref:Uncharacterized protein n=1 Tax=Mythimna loreyi TaxID=667449 RepID=A0ACC2QE64_9NEOP|nr:hypothetical protein PYW08_007403 [Mythimna loreyi]